MWSQRPSDPSRACLALFLTVLSAAAVAAPARSAVPTGFFNRTLISGLNEPIGLAFIPDGRLLFIEQRTGKVRMVVNGHLAGTDPVLTVGSLNTTDKEEGLLGIAVDPGWPARPYVYVYFNCASTPRTKHIARFTLTGDVGDPHGESVVGSPASRYDVLTDLPDDVGHHNGGTLRFGTDGKLYLSIGDCEQRFCAAQDTSAEVGRILRLDVSALPPGPGGPPLKGLITPAGNPFAGPTDYARLTFALGLRNPFRIHVDSANGQLIIADVGEIAFEEIDLATTGGLNFGWPYREGNGPGPIWTVCPGPGPSSPTNPIFALDRSQMSFAAIISAGRYRVPAGGGAAAFPAGYDGDIFYSDYYVGFLRRLRFNGSTWPAPPPAPGQPNADDWATGLTHASDFLEGPDGALWYVRGFDDAFDPSSGMIGRIARDTLSLVAVGPGRAERGEALEASARPNPTRGGAQITFRLAAREPVDLAVHDLTGRVVRRLIQGEALAAGPHAVDWDGQDQAGRALPSGLYFVRLRAGSRRAAVRIALTR